MRLTIIPIDKFVSIDGVAFCDIDFVIDPAIHAVQWMDTAGWIEYKEISGVKPDNESISDISQFDNVVAIWRAAYEASLIPPPPPPEPTLDELRAQMSVTPFQAKAALLNDGLLDSVEALVNTPATDPLIKLAWSNAIEYKRLSPMVAGIATALNWTDTQLDTLFERAALITA